MSDLMARVAAGELLISDGGTGTYLQAHGLEPGDSPELFNLTQPQLIRQIAADYFGAGSDMVETNTFGANRIILDKYGYGERVEEVNRIAAEHVRSQAPAGRYVLGSIGPSSKFMEPNGDVSEEEMFAVFAEQARGLAAGGIDAFCIETMIDPAEITVAIRAAKESTGLPVMATMALVKGPRGYFTVMGTTPTLAVEVLSDAGADVIGSNCGVDIDSMIEIITAMRAVTDKPILTHVNAGMPQIVDGKVVYPDSPERMGALMPKLVEAGANIVGGCCGSGPDHVRAFVKALRGSN
jgi:5-methyltetrahydrofolate--homocysteine methyltransferase